MTAWGVVAVCALGGGAAGPLADAAARHVRPRVAVRAMNMAAEVVPAAAGTEAAHASSGPAPEAAAVTDRAGRSASTAPARGIETLAAAAVTAAACALAAVRIGAEPQLAAYCVLFASLVAVSITDLRSTLVPRRLVYPALGAVSVALMAASAADGTWRPLLDAAVGGIVAFALFAAIWWVFPRGMGFGDVRLAGLCGAGLGWLGFRQLYLGFLAAFVAGALVGLCVLAVRGRRRFPFAPAMAAGTAFGVLWGGWLGNIWLHP